MHKIDFDVKTRRDGSIEVRHNWVHDAGEPHECTARNEFRRYESTDDLAREVTYFLNVAEHYGQDAEETLREGLGRMDPYHLKLLSYMVIDLWHEATIEERRRKVSNQRRYRSLWRGIHEAIRMMFRRSPSLTYGEILSALEREHDFFRQAATNKLEMVEVWKIGKRRRGIKAPD